MIIYAKNKHAYNMLKKQYGGMEKEGWGEGKRGISETSTKLYLIKLTRVIDSGIHLDIQAVLNEGTNHLLKKPYEIMLSNVALYNRPVYIDLFVDYCLRFGVVPERINLCGPRIERLVEFFMGIDIKKNTVIANLMSSACLFVANIKEEHPFNKIKENPFTMHIMTLYIRVFGEEYTQALCRKNPVMFGIGLHRGEDDREKIIYLFKTYIGIIKPAPNDGYLTKALRINNLCDIVAQYMGSLMDHIIDVLTPHITICSHDRWVPCIPNCIEYV